MAKKTITSGSVYRPGGRNSIGIFGALFAILREVRMYRRQILSIFWRDFTVPHRQTIVGLAWGYIMPLVPVTAFIFLRAFIKVPDTSESALIHPVLYVAFGVTIWLMLKDIVTTPMQAVKKYTGLVASTRFPLIGAVIVGFSNIALETLIRLLLCVAVTFFYGGLDPAGVATAIPILAMAAFLALGIGLIMVPLVAALPDIGNVVDIVLRYLIYFSFAIFPVPRLDWTEIIYTANPFAIFIVNIRQLALLGRADDLFPIWILAGVTPVVFLLGLRTFYVLEPYIKESASR